MKALLKRHHKLVLACIIALIAIFVRLPHLGTFMTVDEENWMVRSDQFYDELLAGNPGGTFLTTHPGSTVMLLVGAGQTLQEWRLGFELDSNNLLHFRKSAVMPMVVATAIVVGILVWLVAISFGVIPAAVTGVLVAADPYLTGMTQIAHLDGFQSLLMITGVVAVITYLEYQRQRYLIISGVLLGLALGTKLILAVWAFPIIGGLLLWHHRARLQGSWPNIIRSFLFIAGLATLVFYLTWPALWVKDDVSHSVTRDISTVVTDEHVQLAAGDDPISPLTFYGRTFLGRTTPHVQLLIGAALLALLAPRLLPPRSKSYLVWLAIYGVGFLSLITLAAKKGDRYALPGLTGLLVFASLAFGLVLAQWLAHKRFMRRQVVLFVAAVATLSVLALPLLQTYPIAYNNPFFPNIRPLSQQGWGEGLDQVAAWLNQHPLHDKLYVASWYQSVLNTYFDGIGLSLSSRDDHRVTHVITYRNMGGRAPDAQASNVLDEYKHDVPVHTVYVNDVPYAWVYETNNVGIYTKHIGELIGGIEVGQTVLSETDELSAVEVAFATFSSRNNTRDVVVQIKDSPTSNTVLRTATASARDLIDNEWHTFEFAPLTVKPDQELYVLVASPTSYPGDAVTVRYLDTDIVPGAMHLGRNGPVTVKEGDAAIRIKK